MRIVIISDTHGHHHKIKIPQGDILIHSGDFSKFGHTNDTKDFLKWFLNLKGFDTKIFIAGNHDLKFELNPRPNWLQNILSEENLHQSDCVYLQDESFIIQDSEFSRPIKIYGSPWQPEYGGWAFNLPRHGVELEKKWGNIPDDTDILITHGPPFGIRDTGDSWRGHFGCELLIKRVNKINPLIHCFGHFHYSYGTALIDDVAFINAAICSEQYNPINDPIVVDLIEENSKLITKLIY